MKTWFVKSLVALSICGLATPALLAMSPQILAAQTVQIGQKVIVITVDGKVTTGTLKKQTKTELILAVDGLKEEIKIKLADVEEIRTVK